MNLSNINSIGIIGAGLMGHGIAIQFASHGFKVILNDVSEERLAASVKTIESTAKQANLDTDSILGLIETQNSLDTTASSSNFVIEAVFEDMELKKGIFIELEKVCKSEAILASNTSSLDINEIAKVTNRPEKVCGTHFFSPANVMKLMENVRAKDTSIETVATIMRLSKTLKKTGVLVGVGDGFVGNRMMHVAARVAEFMVEEGALPWQIDEVIYNFGFPMGPFAMNDLAGVDVRYSIRQEQKKLYGH